MSQELVDSVRGHVHGMVAISDAYRLAPDADALVSADRTWWKAHPTALEFAGRKFCTHDFKGTEKIFVSLRYGIGCNSGLQGMRVAEKEFGATKLLLFGFDLHGTHFFGMHPAPLVNATQKKLLFMNRQFKKWNGCPVVNCTPGSLLTAFPFGELERELA